MNLLLLRPTDVLFFRDGRPMSGSLAGHTAAWPMPDVVNHALHAALHRAGLESVHGHDHHRRNGERVTDVRRFGSLTTVGPFPVDAQGRWFFPRPRDTDGATSGQVTLIPLAEGNPALSSLPRPLAYPVSNTLPPSKDGEGKAWVSAIAMEAYLRAHTVGLPSTEVWSAGECLADRDLAETEATIGIGIDPESGTQDGTNIYSAHYLRLDDKFQMGMVAEALDKLHGNPNNRRDLIPLLFRDAPQSIIVGGQQRICSAHRVDVPTGGLPLPRGFTSENDFRILPNGKVAVKWVLLTPALWPAIGATRKDGSAQNAHPGGWLPNWVRLAWDPNTDTATEHSDNGMVLLTTGLGVAKAKRKGATAGGPIAARLVAALVPKPLPVTGWAVSDPNHPDRAAVGGAKSLHFAVPAGAVYYFEAESPEAAVHLAAALNWHGAQRSAIQATNRRSTLLGEKGYGLGVCGTWSFFNPS